MRARSECRIRHRIHLATAPFAASGPVHVQHGEATEFTGDLAVRGFSSEAAIVATSSTRRRSIVRRRRRRAGWPRGSGRCVVARTLADLVVLAHLTFIGFVALGGLLALRWRWLLWLHLPAVGLGVLLEFFGWPCPRAPLAHELRRVV